MKLSPNALKNRTVLWIWDFVHSPFLSHLFFIRKALLCLWFGFKHKKMNEIRLGLERQVLLVDLKLKPKISHRTFYPWYRSHKPKPFKEKQGTIRLFLASSTLTFMTQYHSYRSLLLNKTFTIPITHRHKQIDSHICPIVYLFIWFLMNVSWFHNMHEGKVPDFLHLDQNIRHIYKAIDTEIGQSRQIKMKSVNDLICCAQNCLHWDTIE